MKKLLIANRGEIAVRIARSARELGIKTVAVYSTADKDALHVRECDEAVHIGDPEPCASYLDTQKILDAAIQTGADALHPGYGFLSERADFAEACQKNNITFVGPSPEAMRKLGAKIEAKQLAVDAKVPVTPGYFQPGATPEQLKIEADKIGYPVMLKASAGGGGRGMRIVRDPNEFESLCKLAIDEAEKGFGDGAMMVEKLVEQPRHIEVQVLADHHGNVACLFERECSLQRRHQKLVEEAPSPIMTPELWEKMQTASRNLIKTAEYTNAGTVEFMLDPKTNEFYFLEVNARLQVEHPVTEAITGLDLVAWQLRIAQNQPLDLPQKLMTGDRSAIQGHAIEVRIVAEDPAMDFMPSIGTITGWAPPSGLGVRFDTGFQKGSEVSRFYDSMIAKLIVHAESRPAAIARLKNALKDSHIIGVKTCISYVIDLLDHPEVQAGNIDTGFLGREFPSWKPSSEIPHAISALLKKATPSQTTSNHSSPSTPSTAWALQDSFRNAKL